MKLLVASIPAARVSHHFLSIFVLGCKLAVETRYDGNNDNYEAGLNATMFYALPKRFSSYVCASEIMFCSLV